MDRPDPFYVVRDEIVKSLSQARVEYEAWKHEVVTKSTSIKPMETALRESVRNIDWDLEDLQVIIVNFVRFHSYCPVCYMEMFNIFHLLAAL